MPRRTSRLSASQRKTYFLRGCTLKLVSSLQSTEEKSTTCPYLVGVSGKRIKDTPLAQFQWTEANGDEYWKIHCSINTELKNRGPPRENSRKPLQYVMAQVEDEARQHSYRHEEGRRSGRTGSSTATSHTAVARQASPCRGVSGSASEKYLSQGFSFVQHSNKRPRVRRLTRSEAMGQIGRVQSMNLSKLGYIENLGGHGQIFAMKDTGYERWEISRLTIRSFHSPLRHSSS